MGKPSLQDQMQAVENVLGDLRQSRVLPGGSGLIHTIACLEETRRELQVLATEKIRRKVFVRDIPFTVVDE